MVLRPLIGLSLMILSCADQSSNPNRIVGTIRIDNLDRRYLLALPPSFDQQQNQIPLVVFLHGTGGRAEQSEHDYGISSKAGERNFAVVYPEGISRPGRFALRTWNAGNCCDYAMQQNINDVEFIRRLILHLQDKYRIDADRVYITGISNGAMMAYRLACEIPDMIAAIAPVSGPMMVSKPCSTAKKVPVLHIHSELDNKIPFNGGKGIGGYTFQSADSSLKIWAGINGCDASAAVTNYDLYYRKDWNSCIDAYVSCLITKDGGHSWPGGLKPRGAADEPSSAFDATQVILDFFSKHVR